MREAQYIRTLPVEEFDALRDDLDKCGADRATAEDLSEIGDVTYVPCDIDDALRRRIVQCLLPGGVDLARSLAVYCTREAYPHVDECIVGDYTAVLVLDGAHVLFTGNWRPVCDLTPGVVCLLNNKRLHGARPKVAAEPQTLLFVAVDFCAESMRKALKLVRRD